MAFPNPYSVKIDDTSTITALETNTAGTYISRAIDGTGGGGGVPYTPSTPIEINGTVKLGASSGLGANLQLAARSVVRVINEPWIAEPAEWVSSNFPYGPGNAQAVLAAGRLYQPLRIPHGATLDTVTVSVEPGTHAAGFPSSKPKITLYKIPSNGVEVAIGVEVEDPTAVLAVYEAAHNISLSPAEVIDRTLYRYCLLLKNESGGAGYVAGLQYIMTRVTFTTTAYEED